MGEWSESPPHQEAPLAGALQLIKRNGKEELHEILVKIRMSLFHQRRLSTGYAPR